MFSVERRCVPRPSRLALAAFIACVHSAAAPMVAAQPGGCRTEPKIFVSEVAGSPHRRFEGRICSQGTPAQIAELFHLEEPYTEWLYRCEQARILTELGAGHRIFYFRYDGPLFFPDQELLVEALMQRSADGESVRVNLISLADDDPRLFRLHLPRAGGSVRARSLDAEWSVSRISAGWVEIRYRVWLVPGGLAPATAANALTRISVRKSLRNLKRVLESGRFDLSGTELFDGLPLD